MNSLANLLIGYGARYHLRIPSHHPNPPTLRRRDAQRSSLLRDLLPFAPCYRMIKSSRRIFVCRFVEIRTSRPEKCANPFAANYCDVKFLMMTGSYLDRSEFTARTHVFSIRIFQMQVRACEAAVETA